jgi:hypothetical protein
MLLTDTLQFLVVDKKIFGSIGRDDMHSLPIPPGTVTMFQRQPGPVSRDWTASPKWRKVRVAMLGGMGWLYLYVFHGEKTCSKEHHYRIAAKLSVPNEWLETRFAEIRRAVQYYPISRPATVCGTRGPVFALT